MEAKHTRGPWVINDLYADTEIRGPENSGALICVMSQWGTAADEPSPQRANARLIAVSPELFEVLNEWLRLEEVMATARRSVKDPSTPNRLPPGAIMEIYKAHELRLPEVMSKAAAAIAKATGATK